MPTYAVTLYLKDAVPGRIRERWRNERKMQIEAMLGGRKALDASNIIEMIEQHDEAVRLILRRNHGSCILGEKHAATLAMEELKRFDGIRYRLYAWCIMPNHVRMIIQPIRHTILPELLHQWKIRTTIRVNKTLRRSGRLWHSEHADCIIECADELLKRIEETWVAPDESGLRHWIWRWRIDRACALETTAPGAARTRSCPSSATHPTCRRP